MYGQCSTSGYIEKTASNIYALQVTPAAPSLPWSCITASPLPRAIAANAHNGVQLHTMACFHLWTWATSHGYSLGVLHMRDVRIVLSQTDSQCLRFHLTISYSLQHGRLTLVSSIRMDSRGMVCVSFMSYAILLSQQC